MDVGGVVGLSNVGKETRWVDASEAAAEADTNENTVLGLLLRWEGGDKTSKSIASGTSMSMCIPAMVAMVTVPEPPMSMPVTVAAVAMPVPVAVPMPVAVTVGVAVAVSSRSLWPVRKSQIRRDRMQLRLQQRRRCWE